MRVRKVRGQNRFGTVRLSKAEVELVRRMGVPIEKYIKVQLVMIAKKRKWKWYFEKEQANG